MRMQHNKIRRQRAAFTLMEMLIVVAIIVALAGISVVSYFALFEGSKADIAETKIRSLSAACDAYRIKNGSFPPSLQALLQNDPKGNLPLIEDPASLHDPWNQPFQYDSTGSKNNKRHADIWTQTPEGRTIGNWPTGTH